MVILVKRTTYKTKWRSLWFHLWHYHRLNNRKESCNNISDTYYRQYTSRQKTVCTQERKTIFKVFLEIQDGDQTEVLSGKFVLSLLSYIQFMMLNGQRLRLYKFRLFPLSEPYNPLSWWTIDHSDPFSNIVPRCSVFSMHNMKKNTYHLPLLWILNSGSIGVTRTSMGSYNRSVAAWQAKCLFWLLTALPLENSECCLHHSKVVFELVRQISRDDLLKITRYTG